MCEERGDKFPSHREFLHGHHSVQVTVVLPCYNEEEHVVPEVERICRGLDASDYTYELLVIDDGSTDRTWSLLEAVARHRPTVRAVRLPRNGGSGTARRLGTQWAGGTIVVWTDADMTYPNEHIAELLRVLEDDPSCDQVVGVRTSEQGTCKFLRVPAKWMIRKLAERLIGCTIPDLNSGFRAFRREAAAPYLWLLPTGFSCVTTMTLAFLADQRRIDYVRVSYSPRSGRSKFHVVHDAYRYLLQVVSVVMYFNPVRVLVPVAVVLVGSGALKGGIDVVRTARVALDTVVVATAGIVVFCFALLADLIVRSRSAADRAERGQPSLGTCVRRTPRSTGRSTTYADLGSVARGAVPPPRPTLTEGATTIGSPSVTTGLSRAVAREGPGSTGNNDRIPPRQPPVRQPLP
jgi:glycosyltransferase involved in cell wall biosynthesis